MKELLSLLQVMKDRTRKSYRVENYVLFSNKVK